MTFRVAAGLDEPEGPAGLLLVPERLPAVTGTLRFGLRVLRTGIVVVSDDEGSRC